MAYEEESAPIRYMLCAGSKYFGKIVNAERRNTAENTPSEEFSMKIRHLIDREIMELGLKRKERFVAGHGRLPHRMVNV